MGCSKNRGTQRERRDTVSRNATQRQRGKRMKDESGRCTTLSLSLSFVLFLSRVEQTRTMKGTTSPMRRGNGRCCAGWRTLRERQTQAERGRQGEEQPRQARCAMRMIAAVCSRCVKSLVCRQDAPSYLSSNATFSVENQPINIKDLHAQINQYGSSCDERASPTMSCSVLLFSILVTIYGCYPFVVLHVHGDDAVLSFRSCH